MDQRKKELTRYIRHTVIISKREFTSFKRSGSEIQKNQWQCFWPGYFKGSYKFCKFSLNDELVIQLVLKIEGGGHGENVVKVVKQHKFVEASDK